MRIKVFEFQTFKPIVDPDEGNDFVGLSKIYVDKVDDDPFIALPVDQYLAIKMEDEDVGILENIKQIPKPYILSTLIMNPGVSGFEQARRSYILEELRKTNCLISRDRAGNIIASYTDGDPKLSIGFIAHYDEPGCSIIRHIEPIGTSDGGELYYFQVQMLGGTQGADWENKMVDVFVPLNNVTIVDMEGKEKNGGVWLKFKGKIKSEKELHHLSQEEYVTAPHQIEGYPRFQILELYSPIQVDEEIIQHLREENNIFRAFISYERDIRCDESSDIFIAPGIDNCFGTSILLELISTLQNLHDIELYFIFTTEEEKGLIGARAIPDKIRELDIAIGVDVFPALYYSLEAEPYKKTVLSPGSGIILDGGTSFGIGGHDKLLSMMIKCANEIDAEADGIIEELEEKMSRLKSEFIISPKKNIELEKEYQTIRNASVEIYKHLARLNIVKSFGDERGRSDVSELAKTGALATTVAVTVSGIHSAHAIMKISDYNKVLRFLSAFVPYIKDNFEKWS